MCKVKGQLLGVGSSIPPCGPQGSHSGHRSWRQAPLRAEPPSQPWGLVLESPSVAPASLELEVTLPPQPPGRGDHRCELVLYFLSNFEDKKTRPSGISRNTGSTDSGKSPETMDRSLWGM